MCCPVLSDDLPSDILTDLLASKPNQFVCDVCTKGFSSRSGYLYHICKEAAPIIIKESLPYSDRVPRRRKIVGEILRTDVTSILTPNFDCLMDEMVVEFVLNRHMYGAIKWTYYNPVNTVNYSIVKKNDKEDTVYIYQNNQWIVEKYSVAFEKMFKAVHSHLSTYYFNYLINRESLNGLNITDCDDDISKLMAIERQYDYEYMPLDNFNVYTKKQMRDLKYKVRSELVFSANNYRYPATVPVSLPPSTPECIL